MIGEKHTGIGIGYGTGDGVDHIIIYIKIITRIIILVKQ